MKEIGLYIHIPFCQSKCMYCDFYSIHADGKVIDKYFKALIKEIMDVGGQTKDTTVKTIYIGGGTPSFIDSKYIKKVLTYINIYFKVTEDAEITIEVNPGSANKKKLLEYIKAGINRISIGMQSSNNEILKNIGRVHTWEDFLETYNLAREVGFSNINIDCMIGLPGQTTAEVEKTANEIVKLNPEHISVYSLIVEEKTPLEEKVASGEIILPDENQEREMYWKFKKILEENGYIQYEISNFAKQGYESKHNVDCWRQKEYIGIGASAHSYTDGCRYSNIDNVDKYIENYDNNKQEDNLLIYEMQDKTVMAKEFIMLALRTIEGCNLKEFEDKFGYDAQDGFKKEFEKLKKKKLIEINDENIKLTDKGLDVANLVWQEFV